MPGLANFNIRSSFTRGRLTQTAGTVISILVPGYRDYFTRLTALEYTAAGNAHVITVMRPLGWTTLASAAAASQAVLNLTAQPTAGRVTAGNDVAASDYLVWQNTDGTYSFDLVSSVSSLAITMTSNLAKAVAAGNKVWMMGVLADTGLDGFAHPTFTGTASTTRIFSDSVAGLVVGFQPGDPLLIQSNNATAAGTIERASGIYTAE